MVLSSPRRRETRSVRPRHAQRDALDDSPHAGARCAAWLGNTRKSRIVQSELSVAIVVPRRRLFRRYTCSSGVPVHAGVASGRCAAFVSSPPAGDFQATFCFLLLVSLMIPAPAIMLPLSLSRSFYIGVLVLADLLSRSTFSCVQNSSPYMKFTVSCKNRKFNR